MASKVSPARLATYTSEDSTRTEKLSFQYRDASPAERAKIDNLLLSIDQDGDGTYSPDEVRAVAINLLASQRKVTNLKRAMCLGVLAVVAACAVILGLNVAANAATKETAVNGSKLQDREGNDIQTATALYSTGLAEFDPEYDLINLDTMIVTDAAGVEFSLNVEGHSVDPATGVYKVYLARGYTVVINPGKLDPEEGATMSLESSDGSSYVFMSAEGPLEHLIPAPGRRLQLGGQSGGRRNSMGNNRGGRPPFPGGNFGGLGVGGSGSGRPGNSGNQNGPSFGGQNGGSFGGQGGGNVSSGSPGTGSQNGGSFGGQNGGSFGGQNGGSFGGQNGGSFGGQNGGSFGGRGGGNVGNGPPGTGNQNGGSFGGRGGGNFEGGNTGSGFGGFGGRRGPRGGWRRRG